MKTSFTFDGEVLRLRLDVEDATEKAMAALIGKLTIADVSLQHDQYSSMYRTDDIKAISIHLRKPEEA